MTVLDTPARTDLDHRPVAETAKARHPYRVHGLVLTTGAALWATAIAIWGNDPSGSAIGAAGFGVGSGAFQIGLLFLLRVLWRSGAIGTGKVARSFLVAINAFVVLAMCSTFVDAIQLSDLSRPGWLILDLFWPISMISMFGLAIRIAIAGHWRGLSRFWPLVAESWAVCVIPTQNLFGSTASTVVGALHLLIGYCVLGIIVARKTH